MELSERLDRLEAAVLAVAHAEFGDFPGHPFRGNQHSGGGGEGEKVGVSPGMGFVPPIAVHVKDHKDHARSTKEREHRFTKQDQQRGANEKALITQQRAGMFSAEP